MNRETCRNASLCVNVLLAGMVVMLAVRGPASAPPPQRVAVPEFAQPMTIAPSPADLRVVTTPKPAAASDTVTTARTWVEQLRAAGAPDKVLVRVAQADFDERWRVRFDEMQERFEWGDVDEGALAALGRERDREQERELRSALGEEAFRRWDQENTLQSLSLKKVRLSTSEAEAVYYLQKGLQQQSRDLERAKDAGEIDETDLGERQSKAQAQFDERLKALLGEKRFATRNDSDDADSGELRRSLRKANASDAQFETLLQAQRKWVARRDELERQRQSNQLSDTAYEDQIKAFDLARDQEYQRVLGTNGFEALQKVQDARYVKMKRYAGTWGMDDHSIDYLYRTLKSYEKSLHDYPQEARALEQRGEAVDWDTVNKDLRQFSKQTEEGLQNFLGQERYHRLKQNGVLPFQTEE